MANALISFSKRLKAAIQKSNRITIATHIDPDFDGLAAALAMGHMVRSLKQKVPVLFCDSEVPVKYKFILHGWRFERWLPETELLIVVDSASLDRIFHEPGRVRKRPETIVNIDHHKSNIGFGALNYNDGGASSACEIVYDIYRNLKIRICREAAEIIYSGLYSETGGFVYPNTSSNTLRIASDLIEQGIKPGDLVKKINAKTIAGTRLLSRVLRTIQVRGGIGTMYVTKKMIRDCDAVMSDTENFVSFLTAIDRVKVAVFLREQDGFTRISMRSNCSVDVDHIARKYGGGGHRLAAGIKLRKPLKTAMKIISSAVRKKLTC